MHGESFTDKLINWSPFFVVIALFILAIVSPWLFPNKMVSKNKHDNKF